MGNVSTEVADPPPHPVPTARDRYHVGAFIEMLLASIVGLVASLVLSIDAIAWPRTRLPTCRATSRPRSPAPRSG